MQPGRRVRTQELSFVARVAAIVLLISAAGCASVVVRKIETNGKVAGSDGMRFYMPRPYVAVNEPFIVSGEAYLVGGEITPDGKYILINDVKLTNGAGSRFLRRFVGTAGKKIPVTNVIVADGGIRARTGEQAAGEGGQGRESVDEQATGNDEPEKEPAGREAEKKGDREPMRERSGMLNLKVTNDNSAIAVTPLKRYFDIVWLPDFEEQYVVKGKAGLGNSSIGMLMGQGWSLQGIEANVDNSALVGRIFNLIDEGTQILSALGRAQLGLPPVAMERMEQGEQAGEEAAPPDATRFAGGTPLTVKVTFVRIVAPGLYPILKPKEMEKIPKGQGGFEGRILVPVAPLTNIAFNTYEAVVVEAALATGDSALRLHQYIDLRPGGAEVPNRPTTGDPDWKAVSTLIESASAYAVEVSSDIKPGAPVTVKVKNRDGSAITSEDDKGRAKNAIGKVINKALSAHAPGYEGRPIVFEFPRS